MWLWFQYHVPSLSRTGPLQCSLLTQHREMPRWQASGFYLLPLFFCLTAHLVGTSDMSITAFAMKSRGQEVLKLVVLVQLQAIVCLTIKSAGCPLRRWGANCTKTMSQISTTKARANWKTDNFVIIRFLHHFLNSHCFGVFLHGSCLEGLSHI